MVWKLLVIMATLSVFDCTLNAQYHNHNIHYLCDLTFKTCIWMNWNTA